MITERGRRLVHVLLAIALAAASARRLGDRRRHDPGPDARWLSLRGPAALAAAPCPADTSIALPTVSPARIAAARERRFDVFGPKPTELPAPIDWHTDPLDAERYRQNLQKLRFVAPLLSSYAATGNRADLDEAAERRRRLGPPQPVRRPRHAGGGVDGQGDRRPDPVSRLHPAGGRMRGPAAPIATSCALLDSLDQHGQVLASKAELHARQPRAVRGPRPRPADGVPPVHRPGRPLAGAGPRPLRVHPAPAAVAGRVARALLRLSIPGDPPARLDAVRARARPRAHRAARPDARGRRRGS